jgi:hypothetical protein
MLHGGLFDQFPFRLLIVSPHPTHYMFFYCFLLIEMIKLRSKKIKMFLQQLSVFLRNMSHSFILHAIRLSEEMGGESFVAWRGEEQPLKVNNMMTNRAVRVVEWSRAVGVRRNSHGRNNSTESSDQNSICNYKVIFYKPSPWWKFKLKS